MRNQDNMQKGAIRSTLAITIYLAGVIEILAIMIASHFAFTPLLFVGLGMIMSGIFLVLWRKNEVVNL